MRCYIDLVKRPHLSTCGRLDLPATLSQSFRLLPPPSSGPKLATHLINLMLCIQTQSPVLDVVMTCSKLLDAALLACGNVDADDQRLLCSCREVAAHHDRGFGLVWD